MSEENKNEEIAQVEEAKAETTVQETVNPQEFLENFDWHKYEQGIEAVD